MDPREQDGDAIENRKLALTGHVAASQYTLKDMSTCLVEYRAHHNGVAWLSISPTSWTYWPKRFEVGTPH